MKTHEKPSASVPGPSDPPDGGIDVLAELAGLKVDLKQQWRKLFDSEPPPFNRRYLELRVDYRIRELAHGGLRRVLGLLADEVGGGARSKNRIAASKKKGMWMDGYVPLGYNYDAVDRKLIVNEAEAASVRRIFERFIELGSATVLARELRRDGFRNKQGTLIDKGYLYRLLNNRVYRGEARARNDPRPHSARTPQTRPSPPHSAAEACRGRHGPRTQPASAARHRPGLGMAAADGARRGRRHRRSRRRARHLRPPSCAALKGQHPGPEPLRSTTVGCTRIHSRQNAGSKIKR